MPKNNAIPITIRSQPGYLNYPPRDKLKIHNNKDSNDSHLINLLADIMKTIMNENDNYQTRETINEVDNQNIDYRDEPEQSISKNKSYQIILISNKGSIEKSKFGEKFRESLDPRDQLLAHPFQFILEINSAEIISNYGKTSFMKSKAYLSLCEHIEEYLVDVVENVVSVSFNLLISEKLKENQSKDYASKNILLNVRSIFKEVMETLSEQRIIDKKENKKLRFALCQLVDHTLSQVLLNLSAYYPQAPPTGGTPRMREALLSIDRNFNEQLDFLYTQNLKLTKEENGDYTEYIMKVVNRAISVTGEIDPKDSLQQTLFEKFVAFSQHLFWVAQQDSYSSVIHRLGKNVAIDETDNKSQREASADMKQSSLRNFHQEQEFEHANYLQIPEANNKCSFFGNNSIEQKKFTINLIRNKAEETQKKTMNRKQIATTKNQRQLISCFMRKPVFAEYSDASLIPENNKQKTMEEMKRRHDFAIGQKIPTSVRTFNKKDLMDKNFSAKHSAVLRILTKWAQNLENIFDNPQAYTTNRIYPFKTLNHEIIYPKKELKQILCNQITQKKAQKQKIKDYLITRNKVFQSAFFAKDSNQNISKFIKRYTETRVMASKMNVLLIQFMKEYVSSLINLLVEAGKATLTFQEGSYIVEKVFDINLVVFKIGDLMRSKIHCSETTFIRLLKTLYIIEETDTRGNSKPLIELVRIKNKLDSKDNNILINYLFMGKIQCQLQMSVQKMAGKELNYYSFAHFLYELTRGKFGVLAECATIISQHDPIVSSSSFDIYYEPKISTKRFKALTKQQEQVKQIKEGIRQGSIVNSIKQQGSNIKQTFKGDKMWKRTFVCKKCDHLKFEENMDLLKRGDKQQSICNHCLINNSEIQRNADAQQQPQYRAEQMLKDEAMANWIIQNLKNGEIQKLKNYEELLYQPLCLIFSINQKKNELQFTLFNNQESQNKFFISRITKDLWQKDLLKEENVEYEDIAQKITKCMSLPQFTYMVSISQKQGLLKVLQKIKFMKSSEILDKLRIVDEKCQQKILKDSILNILRNKNQSLQFNSNYSKMQIMNNLIGKNMLKSRSKAKWIEQSLRHIQFIFAEEMGIEILPQWLDMCKKTQLLNLSDNNIKEISVVENMVEIKELILKRNSIKLINWKKFTHLERLNVSDNSLNNFQMENLPQSLLEIDLGDNLIQTLNFHIFPPFLKKINVYANKLESINLKNIPSTLQFMDFSYNNLKEIEYQTLTPLKAIIINNNRLSSFKLENLPSLISFDISQNRLQHFSIKQCQALLQLYIGSNNLPKLEIVDFPALFELDISENPLTRLELKELPVIHVIHMSSLVPFYSFHLQIQSINQEDIIIEGNPEMIKFLNQRFPGINFEKEERDEDFNYSFSQSSDSSAGYMRIKK